MIDWYNAQTTKMLISNLRKTNVYNHHHHHGDEEEIDKIDRVITNLIEIKSFMLLYSIDHCKDLTTSHTGSFQFELYQKYQPIKLKKHSQS